MSVIRLPWASKREVGLRVEGSHVHISLLDKVTWNVSPLKLNLIFGLQKAAGNTVIICSLGTLSYALITEAIDTCAVVDILRW